MQILLATNSFQEDIKKSKFLAQAVAVSSVDDALEKITALSDASASHNCWAYRLGETFRFYDDGEPNGTGGRPILAAIDNNSFDHTLVVVTRFYGGIQLGTGGLARAYGQAAKQCLLNAASETLIPTVRLSGFCPYTQLDIFKGRIEEHSASIIEEAFNDTGANVIINTPEKAAADVQQLLTTLTRGAYSLSKI